MAARPKSSTKEKFHLAVEPEVMRALKDLAIRFEKPVGDILEGLVDFTESARFITDEVYVTRFNALLETCLYNAGNHGGWVIPEGGESAEDFIKRKTREDIEAKKRELEEELRKLDSE